MSNPSESRTPVTPSGEAAATEAPPRDEVVLENLTDEQRRAQETEASEVAAKFDIESRTRDHNWRPLALFLSGVAIFTALYHMYTSFFGPPGVLLHRSIHVSLILFLVFMLYPPVRGAQGRVWRIVDGILAVLALVPTVYLAVNYETILRQAGRFEQMDVLVAGLLLMVMSALFGQAAQMQEEQDLTI